MSLINTIKKVISNDDDGLITLSLVIKQEFTGLRSSDTIVVKCKDVDNQEELVNQFLKAGFKEVL